MVASRPTSAIAVKQLATQNPAVFNAAYNRAPTSVRYGGKTYSRNAASTPEQKLWYLAAVAKASPTSVQRLASLPLSLDEVYGLDADRSALNDAEAVYRQAQSAQRAAEAKLKGLKRQLQTFLDRERDAQRRRDAVRGWPAEWYEEGQVKLWQDRQQSIKNGVDVGMSSQQGWKPPLNDGIVQNEAAVDAAREATRGALADVQAAKAAYDAENKRLRDEERAARLAELKDEQARRVEQATAAAEEARANAAIQAASAPTYAQGDMGDMGDASGDYAPLEDLSQDLYAENFDAQGVALFDAHGMTALDAEVDADTYGQTWEFHAPPVGYQSPYGFASYYQCDACAAGHRCDEGGDCYRVSNVRAEALGFDADKITEAGDQGYTGGSTFDFASVLPVIIAAVISLASALISAFMPPPALDDGMPSAGAVAAANASPTPPPMVEAAPAPSIPAWGWALGAYVAIKLLK